MLLINKLTGLDLGIRGENEARGIQIDCTEWKELYENGAVSLYHKRAGDADASVTGASYDQETGVLTWIPTGTDTFYAGEGVAQIRLTEGAIIKKALLVPTYVHASVVNENGNIIGSDWQSYIDEVERLKNEMTSTVVEAAVAGEEASKYARGKDLDGNDVEEGEAGYQDNAKYYKELAETASAAAQVAETKLEGMEVSAVTLLPGNAATVQKTETANSFRLTFGVPQGIQGVQGLKGETGTSISGVILNSDYTMTINFSDGSAYTTPVPIRGRAGQDGRDGRDAAVIALGAVEYSFQIDTNGHLILYYGGEEAPNFYVDQDTGHLKYVIA